MINDHKFFTANLDNNLEKLTADLLFRYEKIKTAEMFGISGISDNEIWKDSNSVSTMKWREYNVFQFHIDEIYDLYKSISKMTRQACEWYNINFEDSKYMVQGWFNVNYSGKGKLDWHLHKEQKAPLFHGYYCVNAEPSQTEYIIDNNNITIDNINNKAILSESGHPHRMLDWDWSGPRITIAYDIRPLENLQKEAMQHEQHWIPLL